MKFKGFSLIELLISLLILSVILTMTTSFMRSGFASNSATLKSSVALDSFQLLTSYLRRDFENMKPIPMIDDLGENSKKVFFLQNNPVLVEFTSFGFASKDFKELFRVMYLIEEGTLIRKQFLVDQPFDKSLFISTELMHEVSNFDVEVFDGERWHQFWPKTPIMERKTPAAVKLFIKQENQGFEFLIPINNETVFKL